MQKKAPSQRGGFLEALLSGSPVAIISVNSKGIITFVNKAACSLSEYEMHELIGVNISEIYENIENAKETNRKLYQGDGVIHDHESKLKTKTGKLVPVRISASHLKDSNGDYIGATGYFEQYRPWTGIEPKLNEYIKELEAKLEEYRSHIFPVFEILPMLSMVLIDGSIDSRRFNHIIDDLMKHIESKKTRVAIFDMLEASVSDVDLVNHLVKALRTLYLMGIQVMLVGVPTSLAKEMEALMEELGTIKAYYSKSLALKQALEIIGYTLQKNI